MPFKKLIEKLTFSQGGTSNNREEYENVKIGKIVTRPKQE